MNLETNNIFFKPWIGENYSTGINGKKILILGESHHCDKICLDCGNLEILHNCDNNQTQNVILDYFDYKRGTIPFNNRKWLNTFTKFANVFNNKKLNNNELIAFWHSLAFYNYVQKALSGPRVSPSSEDFNNSLLAFHELIEYLKPDLIIIWGMRLWYHLPKGIFFTKELNIKNELTAYYRKDNVKIPLKVIYHPSSSKLSYDHSIEINEFINNVS
ncbi:MAG: hypothetical protein ACOYMA_10195 [Bacteroidia bacterium]